MALGGLTVNASESNLVPSILDRLLDDEPKASRESVQKPWVNFAQIKASVVRDLENLLNSRRYIFSPPAGFKEVNRSLLVYGLKDFTAQGLNSPTTRQQIRHEMETTIALFEPRLRNVTVELLELAHRHRNLRFRISGLLVVEPEVEPVMFDTYFDVNRSRYVIMR